MSYWRANPGHFLWTDTKMFKKRPRSSLVFFANKEVSNVFNLASRSEQSVFYSF